MNILILTKHNPNKIINGSSLRNQQTIFACSHYGSVGVIYLNLDSSVKDYSILKSEIVTQEVSYLRNIVFGEITLWRNFSQSINNLIFFISGYGLKKDALFSKAVEKEIKSIVKFFKPDVVIFSEVWFATYLNAFSKTPCKLIYDAHNAESFLLEDLLKEQYKQKQGLRKGLQALINYYRVGLLKRLEQKLMDTVDQVWTCSNDDAFLLKKISPAQNKFFVVPNSIDCRRFAKVRSNRFAKVKSLGNSDEIKHLIYIGSYGYYPNQVAANFLINEICPRLRKQEVKFKLFLVGSSPSKTMHISAQEHQDIVVTGKVENTLDYLAIADVAVIPLFQGGGTRLKLLEAFAAGVPVVTTPKGIEGIESENNVHALVRDNADTLFDAIVEILSCKELCLSLMEKAFELVNSRYSWSAAKDIIGKALSSFPQD